MVVNTRRAGLISVALASAACAGGARDTAGERRYEHDAAARPASADWTLTIPAPPDGAQIGIVSPGAICDGHLFLPDPRHSFVHVVRLSDGTRVRVVGGPGDHPSALRSAEAVAVPCSAGDPSMYVLDARSVAAYNRHTGEFVRRTPRPPNVGISTGGPGAYEADRVVFPALWLPNKEALRENPQESMLRGSGLGYVLNTSDLTGGGPLLPLLDERCRNPSTCSRVTIDRVRTGNGGWIACQGATHEVGVFSAAGALVRRIDARSPRFRDDGSTVAVDAPIPAKMAWLQHNSVVSWCASIGDYIATVHSTFAEGQWTPGSAMNPVPFLNLHRLDGTPILADLALNDLPIASDDASLYVLVYGEARKTPGAPLRLERIRIIDGSGSVNRALMEAGS
jgi:hypothetical protein